MLDERQYVKKVEKTMEALRAACLGQDAPLTSILPPHLQNQPPEQQAEQIAAQLLFAMAKAAQGDDPSPAQLEESRLWLRDATLYLFLKCNEKDRTFAELNRLLTLPQGVRWLLFSNFPECRCSTLRDGEPPAVLEEFDVALLQILKTKIFLSYAESIHTKVQNLLSSAN